MKSLIATVTGTVTGYLPTTLSMITHTESNNIDVIFQHTVWTFTIIVAITAIITWVQKQRDRWIKNHPKSNKSIYDISEEDD